MIKLSVVIPARNEHPNLPHTIYSILHCWEADGFDYKDIEIIVVDNCSDDQYKAWPKPGDKGTSSYLMPRGGFWNRMIRVVYAPIAGNHAARNKGAEIARGEYLFFSDAHVAYKPGFFKSILRSVDESGGIVHGTLQNMGDYPPVSSSGGYGYTIKLGEEIKGTWQNYKISDTWFYVPAQGHWAVCVKKKQFLDFGGYPKVHRTYGGGEFYLNMKWWMFGSTVAVDPQAIGYHLASARGYNYHHDDYIENVLGISYALGMDDWRERAYLNWMRRVNKTTMEKIYERSAKEHEPDRKFIEKRRVKTFNELLVERPWKSLNEKRHGKGLDNILVYHDTWLKLLPANIKEAYDNSKYQKGLEKFINENLSQFVYKRNG